MIPVVGVGAGGHAKVIIDILRQMGQYETVALTDPNPDLWGSQLCGIPIIGDDQLLPSLLPRIRHAFLGIGSVRSNALRPRLFHMMRELDFQFVNAPRWGNCRHEALLLTSVEDLKASSVVAERKTAKIGVLQLDHLNQDVDVVVPAVPSFLIRERPRYLPILYPYIRSSLYVYSQDSGR